MADVEQLQVELEEAKAGIEALTQKNKDLIAEKRKLQAKTNEIDMEAYHKALEENDSLKSTLAKLEKQYKTDVEKLQSELSTKDGFLQKTLVEDGLTKTLLEAGVSKDFLKPAIAMLKSEVKLQNENGDYKAIIGDKALSEFVSDWYTNGDGKVFAVGTVDTKTGTGGKSANDVQPEPPKVNRQIEEAKRGGNVNDYLQAVINQAKG